MNEKTLILLKPDAVSRKLAGRIISRYEDKGLTVSAMKMLHLSREMAGKHYEIHKGKEFYERLLDFITSGPIIAMVIQGEDAIHLCRNLAGATMPGDALPGTIRGDFAFKNPANLVHASDSIESAEREIPIFFTSEEIVSQ